MVFISVIPGMASIAGLLMLFFVPFIFMVTFIMINLIVAVVVDAMNELNTSDENVLDEIHENEDHAKQQIIETKKLTTKTI
ncbi:MAG: hypothetical protein IE909_02370 [Campylobacterales bacterium]|nr:hypothetical protein [Campylobacterales bacterium]